MAAYWWTIWITHIDVHGRGQYSDKNVQNQAAYPGCTIRTAAIATWVHQCTRHGNTSTIIKGLYVSEAEGITPLWWLMTPAQNRPVCLAVKEDTLHGALALPAPRKLTILVLCSPLQAITGASMLLILFYGVEVVPVHSSDHRYTIVDLETKLYHIFSFSNHLQYDNGALCLQWLPNNEPIVKISDDIPHFLPSTGIWYCQALNSLLKMIWLYFSLGSHTLVKQFSHLLQP